MLAALCPDALLQVLADEQSKALFDAEVNEALVGQRGPTLVSQLQHQVDRCLEQEDHELHACSNRVNRSGTSLESPHNRIHGARYEMLFAGRPLALVYCLSLAGAHLSFSRSRSPPFSPLSAFLAPLCLSCSLLRVLRSRRLCSGVLGCARRTSNSFSCSPVGRDGGPLAHGTAMLSCLHLFLAAGAVCGHQVFSACRAYPARVACQLT